MKINNSNTKAGFYRNQITRQNISKMRNYLYDRVNNKGDKNESRWNNLRLKKVFNCEIFNISARKETKARRDERIQYSISPSKIQLDKNSNNYKLVRRERNLTQLSKNKSYLTTKLTFKNPQPLVEQSLSRSNLATLQKQGANQENSTSIKIRKRRITQGEIEEKSNMTRIQSYLKKLQTIPSKDQTPFMKTLAKLDFCRNERNWTINDSKRKINYHSFSQICQSGLSQEFPDQDKVMYIEDLVGIGANTEVRIGSALTNKYIIKIYDKFKIFSKAKKQRIYSEVRILNKVGKHMNIINLITAFENKYQIHLIFEHIENTRTLAQYLNIMKYDLPQKQIKNIFMKIVRGVHHMHNIGVIHRDLKPENVLMGYDEDKKVILKIIDFGIATDQQNYNKDFYGGTPNFLAPELITKVKYNNMYAPDVWALGIILFYMSEGKFPFRGLNQIELYNCIRKGKYEFHKQVSESLKDLIEKMLRVEPAKRITIQQVAKHGWFFQ